MSTGSALARALRPTVTTHTTPGSIVVRFRFAVELALHGTSWVMVKGRDQATTAARASSISSSNG